MELWFQLWHCYATFEMVYTLQLTEYNHKKIAVELKNR